jgi:hypothetical protein
MFQHVDPGSRFPARIVFTMFLSSARTALTRQQRPAFSLPLKLLVAKGCEKICGTVPLFLTPFDFSVRNLRASFDSFDHAIY